MQNQIPALKKDRQIGERRWDPSEAKGLRHGDRNGDPRKISENDRARDELKEFTRIAKSASHLNEPHQDDKLRQNM